MQSRKCFRKSGVFGDGLLLLQPPLPIRQVVTVRKLNLHQPIKENLFLVVPGKGIAEERLQKAVRKALGSVWHSFLRSYSGLEAGMMVRARRRGFGLLHFVGLLSERCLVRVDRGFSIIRPWSLGPRLPGELHHGQEQVFVVKFTYEPLNNGMYTGHGLVFLGCTREGERDGLAPGPYERKREKRAKEGEREGDMSPGTARQQSSRKCGQGLDSSVLARPCPHRKKDKRTIRERQKEREREASHPLNPMLWCTPASERE